MARAQLAILPVHDGRKSERRVVNMAARLREAGASVVEVEVQNLSTDGFMAEGELRLEPDSQAWIKLEGLEPQSCRVAWVEDGKAGFEFSNPLHPATLELIVSVARKPLPRGHFGPRPQAMPR